MKLTKEMIDTLETVTGITRQEGSFRITLPMATGMVEYSAVLQAARAYLAIREELAEIKRIVEMDKNTETDEDLTGDYTYDDVESDWEIFAASRNALSRLFELAGIGGKE